MLGALPPDAIARLRDLVRRHLVVYEVRPAHSVFGGERLDIGYDVELYGTHGAAVLSGAEPQPVPGCERCRAVWDDLGAIAAAVLPPQDRDSSYAIDPFDFSLSYDPGRKPSSTRDRPDVRLRIAVRHREGFHAPIDRCETRCVQDIVRQLRELGAQERVWRPRPPPALEDF